MSRRETPAERRAKRAAVDDPAEVMAAAARLLEVRARSIAELRRSLSGAGYRAPLVDATVERLLELGYLDDAAFAGAWVASRDRSRPRGARALRAELARKGIDEATIRSALADRSAGADETGEDSGGEAPIGALRADEAAAERLVAKRRAALERIADPRARRNRAYALLARAGFDPEIAALVAGRAARGAPNDEGFDEP